MTATATLPPVDPSVTGAPAGQATDRSMMHGVRWLGGATMVLSLLNYAYSIGLTHVLDVADFAVFAAGQALLLTAGTVSTAAVPWVVAQALSTARDRRDRQAALWFGLLANVGLGAAAGVVLTLLASRFAPLPTALVVGAATFLVFLSSSTQGLLQADGRFQLLGGLRVGETALKIVAGLLLVALGTGALGTLAGFGAGSALLIVAGLVVARRDLRPVRGVMRLSGLWRSAAGIGSVQVLVSVLMSADLVLVAVLASGPEAATYQASMILSRVPLFLATAVCVSVFPLVARDAASAPRLLRTAVGVYLMMVLPYAVALGTVPAEVLGLVFPAGYDGMGVLLPLTAASGVLIGAVALLTVFFQADRRYLLSARAQLFGLAVHVVALLAGFTLGGVVGLAAGAVVGSAATVVALVVSAPPSWRPAVRPSARLLAACAVLLLVLLALARVPVAWFVVAALAGAAAGVLGLGRRPREDDPEPVGEPTAGLPGRRLRILHLGFEDWRKPGSGGGAVRTREVNERLARDHDVTVLVSRYRGARTRVEDGVRWVPVGLPLGYFGGMLAYFAALPLALLRHRSDLVVEDFAAPFGSVVPRLWTRRPLVAVVQWLNAEEKAEQYHLPFDRVQRLGVRRHDRFVAMSQDLADRISAGNRDAEVTVVNNGVPREAFAVTAPRGHDVVFLGRLEVAQKGLDLLLDAFAAAADRLPGDLVLVGDGPDRRAVLARAERLGVADRVRLVGRVDGAEKLRLLAGARLVAMPSRFETFGMVAAEAMACGTPVVAFEIPSLREVVRGGAGVLVPAFDTAAFADAMADLAADPDRVEAMGRRGRELAAAYDWDDVAARQETVYRRALDGVRA